MAIDIQSPTDTPEAIADAGAPRVQPPGGEPSRDVLDEARTKAWYRRASKAGAKRLKNADGTSSSLRTTSIERDGTHYLFPTIRELDGELIEMSLEDAEAKAFELGDYLTFASAEEATAASQLISDSLEGAPSVDEPVAPPVGAPALPPMV